MRPDLEHYYLIDQYLENKLTGQELAAFEQQLMQDKAFANEVQEQRMLNNLILEAELKSVRSQIEKDLLNMQTPSFFRMHWQWISAGALCLLGSLFFMLPGKKDIQTVSLQKSAASHIEKENNPDIAPVENTTQKTATALNLPAKTDISDIVTRTQATDTAQAGSLVIAGTPVIVPVNTKTEPALETTAGEENKKTDCSLTKITSVITTENSCMNTETGSIHIDKISGGIAPYTYTLNNKKIKEKNVSALGAGIYEVKISDRNGCLSEQKISILEKNCTPAIQQGTKFNINPMLGETCSIAFDTDKKGSLTIYNRSGKIVYRVTNPSLDYIEWNGSDGTGALAEAGLYVYLIDYTDGTKVTGEVTITR
ncbi:gliding motility-associated C-terminal domain-containing protein [Cytophaga hutchinsonii]|nr:gliding motility-associated C-terminal domain-containing protein [Cytophaga hutchinsonii]SFX74399.1 SprB repeat-containing protein [Cytophaga hutchinsonii ATCC 33406]